MKWVGIGLVFFGCTSLGFIIDSFQAKRIKELWYFIYTFQILKGEIDYSLTPLPQACKITAKLSANNINELLSCFADDLSKKLSVDTEAIWQKSIENKKPQFNLNKEDWQIVGEFSKGIGYVDKTMQKQNLDRLILQLNERYQKAKERYDTTSKLNKRMGILVGACISIFLI